MFTDIPACKRWRAGHPHTACAFCGVSRPVATGLPELQLQWLAAPTDWTAWAQEEVARGADDGAADDGHALALSFKHCVTGKEPRLGVQYVEGEGCCLQSVLR